MFKDIILLQKHKNHKMVKYLCEKYPKGTFKGQKTDGKYMDGYLYSNLKLLANKIVNDMTYLGIIFSSTLEVGTGKSVLATQIGEAWSDVMKQEHNIDVPFDINNIVWRPKELIERAFKLPKYSYILLDEWEDASYWSELGMTLRQFFRKCRQLNLFIMVIIPNWFQMNLNYAVSRSIFAIDVKFDNNLDRGYFGFYNFKDKRFLYIMGKRSHNYFCTRSTFRGIFLDGYGVPEKEYRRKKMQDMLEYDKENPEKKTIAQREKEIKQKACFNFCKLYPDSSMQTLAKVFNVAPETISRWKRGDVEELPPIIDTYNIKLESKEVIMDENRIEEEKSE